MEGEQSFSAWLKTASDKDLESYAKDRYKGLSEDLIYRAGSKEAFLTAMVNQYKELREMLKKK